LQNIHDSVIENKEENITLKTFIAHQKILYKKLTTTTCEESSQEDSQTWVFKDSKAHSQRDDDCQWHC